MKNKYRNKRDAFLRALALAGTTALCSSVSADPVTLRSTDGTINLEGELIGFFEEYYLLQTELGDLRIAATRVRCEGAACPVVGEVQADVTIGGSDTVAEGLMPLLLAGFATANDAEQSVANTANQGEFTATLVGQQGFGDPIGTYLVSSGRSGDAFTNLTDGSIDIGMSSRRISPDEIRTLSEAGAGNMIDPSQEHIVAVDGLVMIVNASNPIEQISLADVARIYSGQVRNWRDIGGPDLPISVVTRGEGSGTATVFRAGIFGSNAPANQASSFEAPDNVEAAVYVDDNPGAIAYVGFAFKRGQKPLTLISECGIGTTPDAFSVKTEEYALFRRLYLYNRAELDKPIAQQFVNYAASDAANNVILQSGFISLGIERVALELDGMRADQIRNSGNGVSEQSVVSDMLSLMGQKDRLSSTFRFRTGSTQLDPRALVDLERLATYLETVPAGSEVTLVGFADSVGAFEPNIALSQGRADEVRIALNNLAGDRLNNITVRTVGFGEVSPAACNTNESGRLINRRVETWIRTP